MGCDIVAIKVLNLLRQSGSLSKDNMVTFNTVNTEL